MLSLVTIEILKFDAIPGLTLWNRLCYATMPANSTGFSLGNHAAQSQWTNDTGMQPPKIQRPVKVAAQPAACCWNQMLVDMLLCGSLRPGGIALRVDPRLMNATVRVL